jgi:hypothetical protein
MLQSIALLAALSFAPAQGSLTLSNDRITFGGVYGPTRPDNRFLPGDAFFLCFDIEGLRSDAQGRVEYSMAMVVTDVQTGKVIFEDKPSERQAMLPLGASKLPAYATLLIALDLRGKYNCKMTVTDKATNIGKSLERQFEVGQPAFGIVCFHTTYDENADHPAPMMGMAGQTIWMHFVTVGFARNPSTKQPHNAVEMRVYDSSGKPTTEQPIVYEVKNNIKEDVNAIEWHLPLPLNRAGTYTVELKAQDKLASKDYKITFGVGVYPSAK